MLLYSHLLEWKNEYPEDELIIYKNNNNIDIYSNNKGLANSLQLNSIENEARVKPGMSPEQKQKKPDWFF